MGERGRRGEREGRCGQSHTTPEEEGGRQVLTVHTYLHERDVCTGRLRDVDVVHVALEHGIVVVDVGDGHVHSQGASQWGAPPVSCPHQDLCEETNFIIHKQQHRQHFTDSLNVSHYSFKDFFLPTETCLRMSGREVFRTSHRRLAQVFYRLTSDIFTQDRS